MINSKSFLEAHISESDIESFLDSKLFMTMKEYYESNSKGIKIENGCYKSEIEYYLHFFEIIKGYKYNLKPKDLIRLNSIGLPDGLFHFNPDPYKIINLFNELNECEYYEVNEELFFNSINNYLDHLLLYEFRLKFNFGEITPEKVYNNEIRKLKNFKAGKSNLKNDKLDLNTITNIFGSDDILKVFRDIINEKPEKLFLYLFYNSISKTHKKNTHDPNYKNKAIIIWDLFISLVRLNNSKDASNLMAALNTERKFSYEYESKFKKRLIENYINSEAMNRYIDSGIEPNLQYLLLKNLEL